MAETRFTWREDKNLSNRRKHGIGFEVAVRVFLDPVLHLSVQDRGSKAGSCDGRPWAGSAA